MARAGESSGKRLLIAVSLLAASLGWGGCTTTSDTLTALGGPCDPTKTGQCADKLCFPLDSATGVCSRDCSQTGICPDNFKCSDTGTHGLLCLKSTACTTDDGCPSGHHCDLNSGECYVKVARQLCAPCTDNLQCPEGGACFTVPSSGERYCTTACGTGDTCPTGFSCREVPFFQAGGDGGGGNIVTQKQCVPSNAAATCEAGRTICAPCKGDDECGGFADLCVRNVVSGEQFCGTVCDPARPGGGCAKGFNCLDLSGADKGPYQCVPNSGTCKDFCDSSDAHTQVLQCGLGRECIVADKVCQAAADGRECSPCSTDDDCKKPGYETNQCVVNTCASCKDKGETFCAEPCPCSDDTCTDGVKQCEDHFGTGFICTKIGSGAFCVPQRGTCLTGLGRVGDPCPNGTGDCVTGVCLSYGKVALCSADCGKDVDCGDSHYICCDKAQGFYDCSSRNATSDGPLSGKGVCAPNGGLFGDDCRPGRPPCQSGTCLDIGTAQLCTVPCDPEGNCPTDFECRDAYQTTDTGTEPVKICFPNGGGVAGSDCTFGPAACSASLCIKKDSGPVCTIACDDASTCPDPSTWTCVSTTPVGETNPVKACIPPDVTVPANQ